MGIHNDCANSQTLMDDAATDKTAHSDSDNQSHEATDCHTVLQSWCRCFPCAIFCAHTVGNSNADAAPYTCTDIDADVCQWHSDSHVGANGRSDDFTE